MQRQTGRAPSPCAFPIHRRGGFHIRPCPPAAGTAPRAHIECAPTYSAARRGAEIKHLLPRLFDGSARSDRSSDGKRSMGIGLSVCRTIVLAHGGVIRGDNRQEGGAVFTVTLPMKGENDED